MTKTADIAPWVELYRALGCPALNENLRLEHEFTFDQLLIDAFIATHTSLLAHPRYGSGEITSTYNPIDHFRLGETDLNLADFQAKLLDHDAKIELSFPQNHEIRFHQNTEALIKRLESNKRLKLPEFYYLIDENYFHGKDVLGKRPNGLGNIDSVTNFTDKILALADVCGERNGTHTATFYVTDSERKGHIVPITIDLAISPNLLDLPSTSFVILDAAVNMDPANAHNHEKKLILKTALHETIAKHDGKDNIIKYLFEHWAEVDNAYHKHLETFIEGISFNKLRHEVEERGLSFLNDLNNSLSEISMKLTALPASFGVWVFFARNDQSLIKMLGFLVAISLITLLLNNSLKGLFEKLNYIENLIKRQIGVFNQKSSSSYSASENSKLKSEINSLEQSLTDRINTVRKHLYFYKGVLWMPVLIMLGVFLYQYSLIEFFDFAVKVASCLPLPQ